LAFRFAKNTLNQLPVPHTAAFSRSETARVPDNGHNCSSWYSAALNDFLNYSQYLP